jgi:CheY-like chemotaxis protein
VILEVAKELLEEIGCNVHSTDSGFEALEIIEQHPEISLALIDRIMPKMDGFTLLKKIKEVKPELKVIFASGFITEADVEEFRKHGAHDFIQKPYKLEELLKLLNNV